MSSHDTAKRSGRPLSPASPAVQLSNEHDRLNRLYSSLQRDLNPISRHAAYASFVRLRDALEAHFEVEDRVHFPTIQKFRPEFANLIRSLQQGHTRFRKELTQISQIISAGEIDESRRLVGIFAQALADHEKAEEDLLAQVMETPVHR
jgi:iron-sulfur cluster repair protein YtfE (RIC family)